MRGPKISSHTYNYTTNPRELIVEPKRRPMKKVPGRLYSLNAVFMKIWEGLLHRRARTLDTLKNIYFEEYIYIYIYIYINE